MRLKENIYVRGVRVTLYDYGKEKRARIHSKNPRVVSQIKKYLIQEGFIDGEEQPEAVLA